MRTALTAGLVFLLAACTSPEATRTLGGGPGADTGNRGTPVLMHEGALPYEGTPQRVTVQRASIEPAQHAHELSRR